MSYLEKKRFLEWAESIWGQNSRNLIKKTEYCKSLCPYRDSSDKKTKRCTYYLNSNYYGDSGFIACKLYAVNSHFDFSYIDVFEKRNNFRKRCATVKVDAKEPPEMPQQKKTKKQPVPNGMTSGRRKWNRKTAVHSASESFNMTNRTAADINTLKVTFVNGRLVSTGDLRNDNS